MREVHTGEAPPREVLESWARQAELNIEKLRAKMEPLEHELAAERESLDLIRRLIGLASAKSGSPPGKSTQGRGDQARAQEPSTGGVEDNIQEILAAGGKPMHISAIREALIARGLPLPGRGDEANIIVRLRRDADRFVRTGRGMYGLSSWGIAPVAATRKVRVRRRRSKT